MANTKELKDRIKSVRDTQKITNAMYMISSSKMKRAKKILADTEPYFYGIQSAISRSDIRHLPDIWQYIDLNLPDEDFPECCRRAGILQCGIPRHP